MIRWNRIPVLICEEPDHRQQAGVLKSRVRLDNRNDPSEFGKMSVDACLPAIVF
jgi:hypothetical protein